MELPHFHPSDANDWLGGPGTDEVIPNTKFFEMILIRWRYGKGPPEELGLLAGWQVGFDGFRLDFVRGFQEASFLIG